MPEHITTADPIARINRLLVALSHDVQSIEGRTFDFDHAEQMQRTIQAARAEPDALDFAADEAAQAA
ncbi:MAG: hypothetical protein DMF64_21935 [Acidobacteria bacterium]|nr:MAG: hypothetical protein DMF64_21935 [Acidobacteriota bacterium]